MESAPETSRILKLENIVANYSDFNAFKSNQALSIKLQ